MRELLIREERKDERRRVEELTRDAFWDVFKPGCDEHYILHNFRSSPDFIGELSCVATDGGELVGHVAYSRAVLEHENGTRTHLVLAGPLSVRPDRQRQGAGSALMRFTLEKARRLGYVGAALYGWPDYYPRFGFVPAKRFGITDEEGNSPDSLQVAEFRAGALNPGILRISPVFFDVPSQKVAAFDATFPPREKHVLPTQLFKEGQI